MKVYEDAIATEFRFRRLRTRWQKPAGFPNSRYSTTGALYASDGHLIHESVRRGGMGGDHVISSAPLVIDPATTATERISGSSVYIGNHMLHYGHFITEELSRLTDYLELGRFQTIACHPFIFERGAFRVEHYQRELLEHLDVPADKLRVITGPTRFDEVHVAEQMWTINGTADRRLMPLYERIRSKADIGFERGRYFLSRRPREGYARISNIPQLEALFSDLGFSVLFPEEMAMRDQLALYSNAAVVATISGSSAHNIVFAGQLTTFVELGDVRTPDTPIRMQQLANSVSIARYFFVPFTHQADNKSAWCVESLGPQIQHIANLGADT